MPSLSRSFYTQSTISVAKHLLGKIIVRKSGNVFLSGKIIEVEAYLFHDPACHAFKGMTERNKIMFNRGGYLYVYFTYGMHYCANIVTYKEGFGEAVLLRAVEPIKGIDVMRRNRKIGEERNQYALTNGPAKFAQAFGLTTRHSGIDLTCGEIFLLDADPVPASEIVSTTRIGIRHAAEKRWRYYIKNNPWVSKK